MPAIAEEQASTNVLRSERALAIARADAEMVYRDLTRYRIEIALEPDGWHVDYRIKERFHCGGGPHYIIDASTGAIVSKRYYQ